MKLYAQHLDGSASAGRALIARQAGVLRQPGRVQRLRRQDADAVDVLRHPELRGRRTHRAAGASRTRCRSSPDPATSLTSAIVDADSPELRDGDSATRSGPTYHDGGRSRPAGDPRSADPAPAARWTSPNRASSPTARSSPRWLRPTPRWRTRRSRRRPSTTPPPSRPPPRPAPRSRRRSRRSTPTTPTPDPGSASTSSRASSSRAAIRAARGPVSSGGSTRSAPGSSTGPVPTPTSRTAGRQRLRRARVGSGRLRPRPRPTTAGPSCGCSSCTSTGRPGAALDLTQTGGQWIGTGPATNEIVDYFVQVVDASGNVATASNKATNYTSEPPEHGTRPSRAEPTPRSTPAPSSSRPARSPILTTARGPRRWTTAGPETGPVPLSARRQGVHAARHLPE